MPGRTRQGLCPVGSTPCRASIRMGASALIFHRLIEGNGAEVSSPMVRRYVADRKPKILSASGKAPVEVLMPQTQLLGHETEVDFGGVTTVRPCAALVSAAGRSLCRRVTAGRT